MTKKNLLKFDWDKIQNFYDNSHSTRDVSKEFKINLKYLYDAKEFGLFRTRSKEDGYKLSSKKLKGNSKKHTQETKDKISKIRTEYLKNNPDKVPYLLNHSRSESYPEKYFTEVFRNENIIVEKNFRVGIYELDFSIPDKRIDIEIDGSQHYLDIKIVESDRRRTKFLEDNGWDVIRINWSEYNKLTKDDKLIYIKDLKNYIENLSNIKPVINIVDDKVCVCGGRKSPKSKMCDRCSRVCSRKISRPPMDLLMNQIEQLGYSGVGRLYGVSDNSIRKWVKKL